MNIVDNNVLLEGYYIDAIKDGRFKLSKDGFDLANFSLDTSTMKVKSIEKSNLTKEQKVRLSETTEKGYTAFRGINNQRFEKFEDTPKLSSKNQIKYIITCLLNLNSFVQTYNRAEFDRNKEELTYNAIYSEGDSVVDEFIPKTVSNFNYDIIILKDTILDEDLILSSMKEQSKKQGNEITSLAILRGTPYWNFDLPIYYELYNV